jgi:hypothetical protein
MMLRRTHTRHLNYHTSHIGPCDAPLTRGVRGNGARGLGLNIQRGWLIASSSPGPASPAPCGEAALVHGSRPEGRAMRVHLSGMCGLWSGHAQSVPVPRSALGPGRPRATADPSESTPLERISQAPDSAICRKTISARASLRLNYKATARSLRRLRRTRLNAPWRPCLAAGTGGGSCCRLCGSSCGGGPSSESRPEVPDRRWGRPLTTAGGTVPSGGVGAARH